MNIVINNSGKIIPKEGNEVLIRKLKKDLTVTPFSSFGNFSVNNVSVYKETPESLVIPVNYAEGSAAEGSNCLVDFKKTENISLTCNAILRKGPQTDCFEKCILEKKKEVGGGIISIQTGGGKCLGRGTKVILFNGKIKNVEDIKLGDKLLGDDNCPRTVLSTISGKAKLYSVNFEDSSFVCNSPHLLTLKNDILIDEHFLRLSYFCPNKLGYVIKKFKTLGDTLNARLALEKMYSIIHLTVKDYLRSRCTLPGIRRSEVVHWKGLLNESPYQLGILISSNEDCKIPQSLLCVDTSHRLSILAGIIDTQISEYSNKYVLKFKCNNTVESVIFLCRSLGYITTKINSTSFEIKYYHSTNHLLPLVKFKNIDLQLVDNSIEFNIQKHSDYDEYFGFEINGNRRFVLADFNITHNTVLGVKLISEFKKKALIIVNKVELMKQWTQELKRFLPGVKVGFIQGKKFDNYKDFDILIGTVQTISMKNNLTSKDFEWAGLAIIDEVHNIASEVFSKVMFKVRPKYLFGLSATLERKDKLEKIITWYIGDILFSDENSKLKQTTDINVIRFTGESSKEVLMRDSTPSVAKMLTNISLDEERIKLIVNTLKTLSENKDRNILVISDRVLQLKTIHKYFPDNSGLFIGSLKSDELLKSKEKQIILGTYGMVNEGFSLAKLNCLVFATPRGSITQAIGRIYRKKHENITPIIVDIIDEFSIFKYQYYKRRKIYTKNIQSPNFKRGDEGGALQAEALQAEALQAEALQAEALQTNDEVCLIEDE